MYIRHQKSFLSLLLHRLLLSSIIISSSSRMNKWKKVSIVPRLYDRQTDRQREKRKHINKKRKQKKTSYWSSSLFAVRVKLQQQSSIKRTNTVNSLYYLQKHERRGIESHLLNRIESWRRGGSQNRRPCLRPRRSWRKRRSV